MDTQVLAAHVCWRGEEATGSYAPGGEERAQPRESRRRLVPFAAERVAPSQSEAVVNDPNVNLGFITMFSFLSFLALETLLALAPVQFLLYYLPWAPQVFGPAVRLLGFAQTPTNVARVTKTLILGALLGVHYFETQTILVPLMRKYNCTNPEARRIWVSPVLGRVSSN